MKTGGVFSSWFDLICVEMAGSWWHHADGIWGRALSWEGRGAQPESVCDQAPLGTNAPCVYSHFFTRLMGSKKNHVCFFSTRTEKLTVCVPRWQRTLASLHRPHRRILFFSLTGNKMASRIPFFPPTGRGRALLGGGTVRVLAIAFYYFLFHIARRWRSCETHKHVFCYSHYICVWLLWAALSYKNNFLLSQCDK